MGIDGRGEAASPEGGRPVSPQGDTPGACGRTPNLYLCRVRPKGTQAAGRPFIQAFLSRSWSGVGLGRISNRGESPSTNRMPSLA